MLHGEFLNWDGIGENELHFKNQKNENDQVVLYLNLGKVCLLKMYLFLNNSVKCLLLKEIR